MKKEDLVALGLDDDQVKAVFRMRGKEIEESKDLQDTMKAEKEAVEQSLEDLKKEYEGYVSPDEVEQIKVKKSALEDKVSNLESEHSQEIESIKYNNALLNELQAVGVHDVDMVKSVLNEENFQFKDGQFEGLDEEISSLKESKGFLFKQEDSKARPPFTTKSQGNPGVVTKDEIMSIKDSSERIRAIQQNKDLFK